MITVTLEHLMLVPIDVLSQHYLMDSAEYIIVGVVCDCHLTMPIVFYHSVNFWEVILLILIIIVYWLAVITAVLE